MKFALVTADPSHKKTFVLNPETSDATGFMQWVSVWRGIHLSYENLRQEDKSYLKDFDVVMMSGHLNYIQDIIDIAKFLKDSNTVTMFYPEGGTQLYDNSVNGYHHEYYEAWNACDILSIVEEDKAAYYRKFVTDETIIRFIHVPITMEMSSSLFFTTMKEKEPETMVVYGDNNPNHPMIAIAIANYLEYSVAGVELRDKDFSKTFPNLKIRHYPKLGQFPYLRLLQRSFLNCYPTEWIGSARQQIACAVVGTPCIGNQDSHTQQRLFPQLGTYIYDVEHMIALARRLEGDPKFYEEVSRHAREGLEFYDMGHTLRRFVDAVGAARDRKSQRAKA